MSSYTKSTDFSAKDALLTGNPLKIIKGTEINDEFNAIQTAVNSKADTNSPALTGTPTAPTAATTTSTTQLATTAFVQQEITANTADLSASWPIGSIYINATSSSNPATLLGFGTWVSFGAGRVLVGLNGSDTDFDTAEETGGAKSTSNTATVSRDGWGTTGGALGTVDSGRLLVGSGQAEVNEGLESIRAAGNDREISVSVDVVQPYIVVYMWKRTA